MTINELIEILKLEQDAGHGDCSVWKSKDEEGNGYTTVDEVEVRRYEEEYLDEYGWDEYMPEENLVVLW